MVLSEYAGTDLQVIEAKVGENFFIRLPDGTVYKIKPMLYGSIVVQCA